MSPWQDDPERFVKPDPFTDRDPGDENDARCGICREAMTARDNCGGDCVRCLAEAGDPDCIKECSMLIGLTGPKQAGKDTVYERAAHIMADVLPVERVSFADTLYESAAASLGVTVDDLRRWKNDPDYYVTVGLASCFPSARQTVREYLQRYGTEAHREVFGGDFWVENVNLEHAGKIVFVTDVRFVEEARAVNRAGGLIARVVGPNEVENAGDGHASEAGLPDELVDFRIPNVERNDGYRALDFALNAALRHRLRVES